MSKHTQGPWRVSTTFGSIGAIEHENGFVAFPCAPRNADDSRNDGESWIDMRERTQGERDKIAAEQDANARLIAAAPDLLEALLMVRDADDDAIMDCISRMPGLARAKVDAAIAKATSND